MIDITRTAMVLAMVDDLRTAGSWTGETHVQKAMYFIEKQYNITTGFDFVLYKHGPYSFDLHDSLSMSLAIGLLEHEIQLPYGPRIQVTDAGKKLLEKNKAAIADSEPSLRDVAQWFGKHGVADLEKLATALWVRIESPNASEQAHAVRIHKLKPHIPLEDAIQALSDVENKFS